MQFVMKQMHVIPMWPFYLYFVLLMFQENQVSALASVMAKPDCVDKCGNLTIPYPFGIGKKCYLDKQFEVKCKGKNIAYMPWFNISVSDISMDSIKSAVNIDAIPYNTSSGRNVYGDEYSYISDDGPYFSISATKNKLVAIGCDIFAYAKDDDTGETLGGCASICKNINVTRSSSSPTTHCTGSNGCCETASLKLPNLFTTSVQTMNTQQTTWASSNCSYILVVDRDFSNFTELLDKYSSSNCKEDYLFPADLIVDWVIGNDRCERAIKSPKYACQKNSQCINSGRRGYTCSCSPGYQGNPYLPTGCQDINECASPNGKRCPNDTRCINTEGSFFCEPNSQRRRILNKQLFIGIVAAISSLILVAACLWLYRQLQKRKEKKAKQRFFKRNGGLLLQQQISLSGQSSNANTLSGMKLFLKEELEKATDNFSERRVLGKGGLGTVYKGMLADGSIVAVKKSNIVEENQVGQFINEILILSQINHRHIVKILGCCLETQVPLLVYEYISNGTLASHIHRSVSHPSPSSTAVILSWEHRLRVAAEAAGALSYLHSYASTAIFHRDIKSSNILLDENFRAVISDFGISRLVPIDKTHLSTLIAGTFGYLDPEYFRSGQLSHRSDVYAFGVVLAELLTSQKAISSDTTDYDDEGLVKRFSSSLKQGRLLEIVDPEIIECVNDGVIFAVAKLAKRCLKYNSRNRPGMKEVAAVLDQLRSTSSDVACPSSFQDNVSLRSESSCSYTSDSQTEDYQIS